MVCSSCIIISENSQKIAKYENHRYSFDIRPPTSQKVELHTRICIRRDFPRRMLLLGPPVFARINRITSYGFANPGALTQRQPPLGLY